MNAAATSTNVGSSTAFHLASLLDLSSRLTDADPVDVLNVAVLSVMGRLKVQRACVLLPAGTTWLAEQRLCKGLSPFVAEFLATDAITNVDGDNPSHAILIDKGLKTLVPVGPPTDPIAIICLGPMIDGTEEDQGVRTYLELVRGIVGTTVQNTRLVRSLVTASKELEARNLMVTTLFESARDFTGPRTKDELLRILSYRLMGQLMVSTFGIFLTEPLDGVDLIVNRKEASALADLQQFISEINEPLRIEELPENSPLRVAAEELGVALATPMTVHGVKKGVIVTKGKLNGKSFSNEEMSFLEALGNTAMTAIENVRLIQEELIKRRLESELQIASDIQRNLLPVNIPQVPRLEVAADARTSRQIGGDYYDVIQLDDHRTLFAIADVSGKGIPAALLMANVQAALNVLAKSDLPLDQLVYRLNTLICDNTEADVFVTMFICIIDSNSLAVEFINAGHNPPLHLSASGIGTLTDGGIILGVLAEPPPYIIGNTVLNLSDILVLYTDGVTEARQGQKEFGVESLMNLVKKHSTAPVKHVISAVQSEVREFTGSDMLDDDSSMVVVRVI